MHTCRELQNWVSAPWCFLAHISLSEHGLLEALGLQATSSVPAKQTIEMAFYVFYFVFPIWYLAPECLSDRIGRLVRAARGRCHSEEWLQGYFWFLVTLDGEAKSMAGSKL